MSQRPTTGTGTSGMLEMKWVRETQVDALIHASDDFNMLVAVALGFLAAAAAAGIALGAGAIHAVIDWVILAACGGIGIFAGIMALRERKNVQKRREDLRKETEIYYIPSPFKQFNLNFGSNETPTVTQGQTGIPLDLTMGEAGHVSDDLDPEAESDTK